MSCEQFNPTEDARHLAVIDRGSGCIAALCTQDLTGPAIPMQVSKNRVELRDGSAEKPILLPRLQRVTSGGVSNILFINSDNELAAWDLSAITGRKRLVIEDGLLIAEDDVLPPFLNMGLCEVDCSGVEYMLGVKTVTISEVDFFQIVAVPKCCCEDTSDVEESFGGNTVLTLNNPS